MSFLNLFSTKPKTSIGIDIGFGGIKLVELKNEKNRPVLSTFSYTESGWGKEMGEYVGYLVGSVRSLNGQNLEDAALRQIASIIKQLHKKSKAIGNEVTASIPVSAVFSAVVSIPKGDEKMLKEAATAEAVKLLPLPEDEMILDFERIEVRNPAAAGRHGSADKDAEQNEKKREKVLVIAASKILVEEYTKIFNYAGLILKTLETESFALIRALLGRDSSPAFLVDIGNQRTNLFVVNESVPIIHRSIHLGGENFNSELDKIFGFGDIEIVEQAKIDLSKGLQEMELPPVFLKPLDPLVQEIKYNLELFKKEAGGRAVVPERIVLTGGSALLPGLTKFLEREFGITTYVADPWARVLYPQALKPVLDAIGSRFAVAIGLGCRNIIRNVV